MERRKPRRRKAAVNISQLVDRVSDNLTGNVVVQMEVAQPDAYADQWWKILGTDARVNAGFVADHWAQVLPESFVHLRELISERSQVAPVNVTFTNRMDAKALLYAMPEAEPDTSGTEYVRFTLGLSPVDATEAGDAQYFSALSDAIGLYYTQIHNGLLVDLHHRGGRIPPVQSLEVWSDVAGDDSPDDIEESLVGETDYVPDPTRMIMMWNSSGSAGFFVMDHPLDNWSYEAGSFFDYSRESRSGRPITPLSIIEKFVLRALGQQPPSLTE
ncbi:hypothetical protein [Tsukamurella pulmonis]|uniref:hypothetical protein n=1 Tax=Tsukamurella pulmonis TaxID=47312 RepID=UPI000AD8C5DA|nr:hypothetical protein [Tsukamurella pulmonis]